MIPEFDFDEIFDAEFDTRSAKSSLFREAFYQHIAAGVLSPEEIRHAEMILRQLKHKK